VLQIKQPQTRTCAGCRKKFPKKTLIGVIRTPQNALETVDWRITTQKNGRSVNFCANAKCLRSAQKRKGSSPIKTQLKIEATPEIWLQLEAMIKD